MRGERGVRWGGGGYAHACMQACSKRVGQKMCAGGIEKTMYSRGGGGVWEEVGVIEERRVVSG